VLSGLTLRAPDQEPEPAVRRRFTFVPESGGTVVAEARLPQKRVRSLNARRADPVGDPSRADI
jgi:hypothetical protein